MVAFDELFIPLPAFRIAICHEHRSAVTAKSVASHVGSQHRHLAARVRQRIAEEASALQGDGSLAADTHGIRFPGPGEVVPAIDGLPVWSDGKKCVQCGHIRRTRKHIQQHCRSEHGWANPRARGGRPRARPAGGLGEAWVDGVHCQRFGQDGALQRLFEVVPPAAAGAQDRGTSGEGEGDRPSIQAVVRAEFEASAKAVEEKDEAAAALISEQSRLSANIWVRRTGWPRHLRGFDREWLAATTQRPDAEEGPTSGGIGGYGDDHGHRDRDRDRDQDRGDDEEEASHSGGEDASADDEPQSEVALAIVLLAVERVVWRAQKASQAEVVGSAAAIMRQESPVVVVMGTGGGKSMLFMLPAACAAGAGGLTVVVVPLVSLRGDIKDRCDASGIECVEWSGRRPHEWASIVLVTPEAAVSESFGHFINRQRAMGRLDRIVVDECHVVLDSGAGGGWRSRMLGLRGLIKAETQLVYLTATLRPADEAEFGRLVGLPGAGTGAGTGAGAVAGAGIGAGIGAGAVQWFRGSTTRANVRYEVRRYDRRAEDEEDVVAALIEEKQAKYKEAGGGQIVVYCDTVRKAEQYAKRLGGFCYHRNVGGAEVKRAVVRQLREGRGQVFTATNALGLGVDAPAIRAVVHVGV
ncbi:hypothetical protein N658DRAFT_562300, partial [Parathielavia hyrcaniae]